MFFHYQIKRDCFEKPLGHWYEKNNKNFGDTLNEKHLLVSVLGKEHKLLEVIR